MSSEQEQVRLLAERIARQVSQGGAESGPSKVGSSTDISQELSVMRYTLEEIKKRLSRIESRVTIDEDETLRAERTAESHRHGSAQSQTRQTANISGTMRSPWLSGMYVPASAHPSQEKFGIEEAAVSELVDFFEGEKKCELEPGGKPCDHCAMCSTRGF